MSAQYANWPTLERHCCWAVSFERSGDWQTVCDRNYENRWEMVVYQHNVAPVYKGEHTIFELTQMLEAASCRPYCLNDWQV